MLSKFLRPSTMIRLKGPSRRIQSMRRLASLIPPNQYDVPIPKRLYIGYVMKEYWEIIPLFVTTGVALSFVFGSIAWACMNKVDTVFTTHSRDNISRTMDLRNPTNHKIVTINQRYEPWPEMQDVLDKMKNAEKRNMARAQSCAQ